MNVFVICVDSWRVDHLGCYGNDWIKTPNIDALAAESMVFDNAYSGGLPTLPQRLECFTGRHLLREKAWRPIATDERVISEALWDKGVESALFADTYHMHKPGMGFERGFDTVRFIRGQEGDPHVVDPAKNNDGMAHLKLREEDDVFAFMNEPVRKQMAQYEANRAHWTSDADHYCAQLMTEAMNWLEPRQGRDDLFLWIDSFDPHETWDPMPPFDKMYQPGFDGFELWQVVVGQADYLDDAELNHLRAQYAGMCSMVDKWTGKFLDRARELGFLDDTMIIFTSDHGEPLGHGKWGHGVVRKVVHWPYEELAHVPFMVRCPDGTGAGQRSAAFVQPCDLAPTILDTLGFDALPKRDGVSWLPILKGEEDAIRDFAVTAMVPGGFAYRTDQWTYIKWGKSKGKGVIAELDTTEPELYDRQNDLNEQVNIIDQHRDIADELDAKLAAYIDGLSE